MNKSDIKLVITLSIIIFAIFLFFILTSKKSNSATVYYKNEVIQKIDLNIDKTYTVKGDNGDVVIEVKNKKIRVNQETSPYNLCSKQGFISSSNESIICLPNKVIVKIDGEDEIDTQVK